MPDNLRPTISSPPPVQLPPEPFIEIQLPPPPPQVSTVDQFKALFNYNHTYAHSHHQPDRTGSKLSTTNLSDNHPWGDVLDLSKPPSVFRLYCQNVNGIKLDDGGGDLHSIGTILKELGCDLVGLCEIKLDVSKYQVRKIVSKSLRTTFSNSRHAACTSTIPFEGFYKPGGTMTLCVNHSTNRYLDKFEDPLGRWSTISLNGKHGRIVHFITVYQVVNKETKGPFTAYQQQLTALKLANRDLQPRPAFILDLDKYLTSITTPNSQFVVMGDFNEVVGVNSSGFAKITSKFSLVDVHCHFHSIEQEVPTYARGKDRIDFIFCSQNLLPAVVACGVEPFNQHVFSDHRALFVDWDDKKLFGSLLPPMLAHPQRRLQSKSIPSRVQYINTLHKYCTDHSVFQRLDKLLTTPSPKKAEAIDRDITRGMLTAESRCRTTSPDPWSIHLQKARLLVDIFKHALSMLRIGLDSRHKVDRLLAKYAEPIDIPDNIGPLKISLRQAQKTLRQVRIDASSHRKALLKTRIAQAQLQHDPSKQKDAERIEKAELMKELHAKLRFISRNGDQHVGLNRLEVPRDPNQDPKTNTEWISVDTPEEITKYLLARNRLHFGQAQGTPFTISPLNVEVDFGATTEACETILSGDYEAHDIDELTTLVIKHFHSLSRKDFLPPSITEKAMLDKYKVWPESTTTSPSGRHLGHYRALLPNLPTATRKEKETDNNWRDLATMHHSLIDYSLRHCHSFDRWKKVVNAMIEKSPGNPKIHRLRVIHLYEADYNLILGIKWREVVHHTEDEKLLHPNLYGARPGRGALDPVFIEELTNEITRLSRKPLIKNADDATACYDRIIPGIGNLASRSHGLHRHVALVQGRTLEDVKYHLKTQLGVSEESYQHCTVTPIYGTGQGSGNSPTIWLVVSSILFRCYTKRAHGARFESPDRSVCIDLFRVGFVDDTCGYVNTFCLDVPSTPTALKELLRHDAQLWSDLLWKSGGELELLKCTYHVSHYKFAADGTPYLACGQVGPSIQVMTGDGTSLQTVPSRSVYNAYKTLGCYKSPSGAQTTQFQVLREKCDLHARITATSALSRIEGWTYYFSKYLTSPGYPLPVCHFTQRQLKTIEIKSLPSLIARCGFNRNTSRNILFGPPSLNGGGFRPFSTEQGVGQLQFFVKHWSQSSAINQLLRIAVAWAQINTGVGYSIFLNVVPTLPHFESKWLNSMRHFLRAIQGQLRLDVPFVPEIQRVNDSFIMDHVLERGMFSKAEVRRINYCRLYLQAVTVSDISDATGANLAPGIRLGTPTLWSGVTRSHKTNQAKPNLATWKLWSRALSLIASPKDELHVPLRQWIVPHHRQRQSWAVYYDPASDSILFPRLGTYERHKKIDGVFSYEYQGWTSQLPTPAYPVSLIEHPRGWIVQQYNSYCPMLPTTIPSSFQSFCAVLDDWEVLLLTNISFHFDPFNIMAPIEESSFIACSDGSAVALEGTYGWVLCSEDGTRLAHGAGLVDGHDPRSFRAEGQGMLSVVCLLRRLFEWCQSSTAITGVLATDNTGLIDRVHAQSKLKYPIPNQVFQPDWDMVQAIVQTQQAFAISSTYQHVKGHQDDDTPLQELSLLSQLNVAADEYAGDFRIQHGEYRPLIPLSPTRTVALDINGKTIHRGFKRAIRDAAHGPQLLEAMQLRYNWKERVSETIDWEVHRQTTHSQKERRTHYVKLCHDILPTGSIICKYGQSLPDYCPLCKSPREDFHHILRCGHPSRAKWRHKLLSSLKTLCYTIKSDPTLVEILLSGLTSWLQQTPQPIVDIHPDYAPLVHAQSEIGWNQFFQGRISTQWAEMQQWHYDGFPKVKGRDGSSWSRKILNHIFTHWNQLWDTRNADLHGKDTTTRAIAVKEQSIRELEILYSYRHKVLQRDATYFFDSLDEHKSLPSHIIRQWINTYQPLILKSAKDAKTKSLLNVRPITTYFGTG